jgi:hypothetical protein
LWEVATARELAAFIENDLVSVEDLLVLVTRDLPTADVAHSLRQLARLIERCEFPEPGFCVDLRPRRRSPTLARIA